MNGTPDRPELPNRSGGPDSSGGTGAVIAWAVVVAVIVCSFVGYGLATMLGGP